MGIPYSSQTNLLTQCTFYQSSPSHTKAYLGEDFVVSMITTKENDDTDDWWVQYEVGKTNKQNCRFILEARRENNRIKNISFQLSDESANSHMRLILDITRVGRDRLQGGITAIDSSGCSNMSHPMFFERDVLDSSIKTTIVPYGCSDRGGLLVLEMIKKLYSQDAYMVNVAHYYLSREVSLSVAAKVRRNKGYGFVVEVEGPFVHPSADLFKVVEQTCRTGIWSPGACSHCNVGTSTSTSSSLSDKKISQILKRLPSSGNVRNQVYTGLINASGHTNGSLNNCVILIDLSFEFVLWSLYCIHGSVYFTFLYLGFK